ncbi:MAG: AAA family ATPase [Acidobacteriaceae bacterium]
MVIESFSIENIRCFENQTLHLNGKKWITLLGPNGCGKSTLLQSMALLLAGPEGAQKLLPRPVGWLRNEDSKARIGIRIQQSERDPGQFGNDRVTRHFGYSFSLTGRKSMVVNNKTYTEPGIVENSQRVMTWLRLNALTSSGKGWFAAGYGAFRRLTRTSQILVPSLEPQARYFNFQSQFVESEPLSAFEQWMVYLDYRLAKGDEQARRQRDLAITAIDHILPGNTRFNSVTSEGRILFDVNGATVPTLSLSDGYRSLLALSGDLVWRLINAFPETSNPLNEQGVVLIDELDIHLHPVWQREIAQLLRMQFPNLQFIVATHSPLIAAGAGDDAMTLKFAFHNGKATVEEVKNLSALRVDAVLQSSAFGLVSPYSVQTQSKIDTYDGLIGKPNLSKQEKLQLNQLKFFFEESETFHPKPQPGSLEAKIDAFLEETLS